MTDANGWPEASKPGVPLNPDRSGWHWLSRPGQRSVVRWSSTYQEWWFMGHQHPPSAIASPDRGWTYLGPCMTPAEVAAQIAAAVAAEREACADVAQSVADEGTPDHRVRMAAIAVRDGIRARGTP
jgi:hypothetical protein